MSESLVVRYVVVGGVAISIGPAGLHSVTEWSTLIGPDPRDPLLSLVEPSYAGTGVYAITTHLQAYLSVCCYGMISGCSYMVW